MKWKKVRGRKGTCIIEKGSKGSRTAEAGRDVEGEDVKEKQRRKMEEIKGRKMAMKIRIKVIHGLMAVTTILMSSGI